MTARLKIVLPLFILIAAAAWYWLTPHYSQQEQAHYVAVFCALHHEEGSRLVTDMRTVIEGGNSDYALQKTRFQPQLGELVVDAWQGLNAHQKAQVNADPAACRSLLAAALN